MSSSKSLNQWRKELPSDYRHCRDTQHNWKHLSARRADTDEKRSGYAFVRILFCETCKTTKFQFLDSRGYLKKTTIKYDEDYLRPKGSGRVTQSENAAMRLMNIKEQL